MHIFFCYFGYGFGHCGCEQPGCFFLRCFAQYLIDIFCKSHVEHLIGLIEYDIGYTGNIHHFSIDEINESPGCGNDDLGAFFYLPDLRYYTCAAIDRDNVGSFEVSAVFFEISRYLSA